MAKAKAKEVETETVDIKTKEVVADKPKNTETSVDINQLMAILAEQKKTIDELTKTITDVKKAGVDSNGNTVVPQIIMQNAPNKYIRVVSLREGVLALSTEPFGQGKVAMFNKYGESKSILDTELKRMVDSNFTFAENGYFYICDENFVQQNELADVYKHILSPQDIDIILKGNSTGEALSLFRLATEEQKSLIITKIICKCTNGEYNEEIISKLEKETGVNIREKIADSKQYYQPDDTE